MAWTSARNSPAAERNKEPIRSVLERVLPRRGLVLEIASGTGQHVAHFARAMPHLVWQPSDPDPEARASIVARMGEEAIVNIRLPLDLDACAARWPIAAADALICINMIHIAPWKAAEGLFRGAGGLLSTDAPVVLYGPFRRGGRHTAPGNAAFDADLRLRNPLWGVRDIEAVTILAESSGFTLQEIVTMPANNCSVIYRCQQRAVRSGRRST